MYKTYTILEILCFLLCMEYFRASEMTNGIQVIIIYSIALVILYCLQKERIAAFVKQKDQELRESYWASYQDLLSEVKKKQHDFHNHLQTLKSYLENGETARALSYIDTLDTQLMNVDTLLKTGNVSLDAILSAKLSQAKAEEIAVIVKANVPEGLLLSDVELSIVVGNLLDNAIEACRSVTGERFLRIFIGMKGKMLYFSMLNSAGTKRKKLGSLFASQKEGFHGFGLRRAETILKDHGGWVKYNSEDGAFTSEFLVPAVK